METVAVVLCQRISYEEFMAAKLWIKSAGTSCFWSKNRHGS